MFSPSITNRSTFSGPSYIGDRTAKRTAQNAYDSELAQSENPRQSQVGKGMGAGSARNAFAQGNRREGGMASAQSARSNSYMDAVEANRMARMQSEVDQAREGASLAGLMQDLAQAQFADRFSSAATQQSMTQNATARNQAVMKTGLSLLSSLLGQ